MVQVRLLDSLEEFPGGRVAWNALASASRTNGVFQSYEWHQAWYKSFNGVFKPALIVAEAGARVCAVMACAIETHSGGIFGRTIIHLAGAANAASDYADIIAPLNETAALEAIVSFLMSSNAPYWNELRLFNVPEASPTIVEVAGLFASYGIPVLSRRICDAPARSLTSQADNEEFRKKKSLKRHYNYFQREGGVSLERLVGDSARHALSDFCDQHVARRAVTEAASGFENSRVRNFFAELLESFKDTDWLHFSAVRWKGQAIAYHFGFIFGGSFIWYKPSFDIALAKKSPGEVLLKLLFEEALHLGAHELDFTVGNEGFKYRFANIIRGTFELRVIKSRVTRSVVRLRRFVSSLRKGPETQKGLQTNDE